MQSGHVASGAVQGFFGATRHLASGTVGSFDLGSGAVVAGSVGSGAVLSGNVASGQVGGGHLASGVVAQDKLVSGLMARSVALRQAVTTQSGAELITVMDTE